MSATAAAFVPLTFCAGYEAYQFDWSQRHCCDGRVTTIVKVVRICVFGSATAG